MEKELKPIIHQNKEGRSYKLGATENTQVTFKADGEEVANKYASYKNVLPSNRQLLEQYRLSR